MRLAFWPVHLSISRSFSLHLFATKIFFYHFIMCKIRWLDTTPHIRPIISMSVYNYLSLAIPSIQFISMNRQLAITPAIAVTAVAVVVVVVIVDVFVVVATAACVCVCGCERAIHNFFFVFLLHFIFIWLCTPHVCACMRVVLFWFFFVPLLFREFHFQIFILYHCILSRIFPVTSACAHLLLLALSSSGSLSLVDCDSHSSFFSASVFVYFFRSTLSFIRIPSRASRCYCFSIHK